MKFLIFLVLFHFVTAVEISRILKDNPIIAQMSMFQEDNSTIPSQRFSMKRSPNDPVSDNFPERYHFTNESMFDSADPETTEIDYRDFPEVEPLNSPPTGRLLSDDQQDDSLLQTAIQFETSTTTKIPFAASETLFDTTVSQNYPAKTSPYFSAFPPTSTPPTWSAENTKMFFGNSIESSEEKIRNENKEELEEEQEIEDNSEEEEEEENEENQELTDISSSTTMGLKRTTFKGTSYMAMGTVEATTPQKITRDFKRDQNEAINYNGRYSVSATKYYVDNRIDGEHYQDGISKNFESVDPFVVEKEMRTIARMHASKTHSSDPLTLEMDPKKDESEEKDTISKVEQIQKNGKDVEIRENTYKNQKTVVELWNKLLFGHDYLRYPGAIFDDKFDQNRRKSGDEKVFASKILLSNSPMLKGVEGPLKTMIPSNSKKKISGVRNISPGEIRPVWKITEDIESVCFNSKKDTGVASTIQPFLLEENIEKFDCLKMCADEDECSVVTYSEPLKICELYDEQKEDEIRILGKSLHRTLGGIGSKKCINAFASDDFRFAATSASKEDYEFENKLNIEDEDNNSSQYLRLVEKDNTTPHAIVPPSSSFSTDQSSPKCAPEESVIFVRSDNQEASLESKKEKSLEITEDDCVFACLTNTRPGGGELLDCLSLEYDRRRSLCYLMQNSPQDEIMTPKPINPVVLYEKTCVTKQSAAKCSGGQPIRFRQKVLIGHLIDAQPVETAAECIDLCISKSSTCFSVMFYYDETTLNCILNDSNHLSHPKAFFDETNAIVDFFSIQECLGIKEVRRKLFNKRRIIQ
ncbi:unnamed protein product [Caenorhabditis angaria]|uniref:Apple domain-containing protein n=1 Tax=Caenorhabditis angaria TaxID=860376 RepID=A0A9P1MWD7_9PELO|nr:unnamed protein product [Caenorhabditis angaria]